MNAGRLRPTKELESDPNFTGIPSRWRDCSADSESALAPDQANGRHAKAGCGVSCLNLSLYEITVYLKKPPISKPVAGGFHVQIALQLSISTAGFAVEITLGFQENTRFRVAVDLS